MASDADLLTIRNSYMSTSTMASKVLEWSHSPLLKYKPLYLQELPSILNAYERTKG